MPVSRQLPLVVFAAWNLVVWGFRLTTIWDEVDDATTDKLALTGLAASHVAAGLVVAAVLFALRRSWGGRIPTWTRPAALAVVLWTGGSWAVRLVVILGNDHEVAFVVVHAVLALGSTLLAGMVGWVVRAASGVGKPLAQPAPSAP